MQSKHRPTQMRNFYELVAMADAQEKNRVRSQSIEWLWNQLRTKSLKLLEIKEGNVILDCGSGKSPLLSILRCFSNIQLVCVDLALTHLKRMKPIAAENRKKVDLILADAENLPFKENLFDRILFSEVIEHLTHPLRAIYEIKRIMSNTGSGVITTPNRQNIVLSIVSAISSLFKVFKLKNIQKSISKRCRERELSEAEQYLIQEGHAHHTKIFSISELIALLKLTSLRISTIEGSALDVYPFAGVLDKNAILFNAYKLLNAIIERTPLRSYFMWTIILEIKTPYHE